MAIVVEEITTSSEAAAFIRVHGRTVYRLAEKGAIPGNNIGKRRQFIKKDVLDLVSNGQRNWLKGGAQRQGQGVVVAADSAQAMEEMGRGDFDVVLTDIRMPGMDGMAHT